MKLRNTRTVLAQAGLLVLTMALALGVRAQSITLYSDFYATQYGVAVTSLTQGQIVNISEGGIWSTNGFNQTYTIDLSDIGEDTYTIILLDAGADGGISFEVNTVNLPFVCGGNCNGELTTGPAVAFNFSLTQLDGIPGTYNLVEGTPATVADSNSTEGSLARFPDGSDSDDAATDWFFNGVSSPGAPNPAP